MSTMTDARADDLQKQITDLQTRREDAEEARMEKLKSKLAKSAIRHAILGFCAPFVGSALAVAWDAFDIADLASMVADFDDQISLLQDQVDALDASDVSDTGSAVTVDSSSAGGGGGDIKFGASADTPLADGTTGSTSDSGRVYNSQGSEVSKWDRAGY